MSYGARPEQWSKRRRIRESFKAGERFRPEGGER